MQGKLSDFSLPEIFQLVANQGKSGALMIRGGDRETVFIFSEGKIAEVQPDQRAKPEMLGTMLVDAGILTDEELSRILNEQDRTGKKLGEILVDRGKVSQEALSRYLLLQIKESLFNTLTLRDGDYRFEGFAVRLPPWITSPARADILMMEGMQFLDEYPIFRGKFPSGDFRARKKRGGRIDPNALPPEERSIWDALDFSDEPQRIFRKAVLTWFEGIRGLWLLVDRGLVDVSIPDVAPVSPARIARKGIRQFRVAGWIRAAAWVAAGALAAQWAWARLLSATATEPFAGWAAYFF